MNFVVMGVAGCGKSTIAKALADKLSLAYLEGDDFHSPQNVALMSEGLALTDSDRKPWLQAINQEMQLKVSNQQSFVLSCSALKQSYRRLLAKDVSPLLFVYLQGTQALIEQRIAMRQDHFMPMALVKSQFATLEDPRDDEHYISVNIAYSVHEIVEKVIASVKTEI